MNKEPLAYWRTVVIRLFIILFTLGVIGLGNAINEAFKKEDIIYGVILLLICLLLLLFMVFVPLAKDKDRN